jgi:prevent-host-death family protein
MEDPMRTVNIHAAKTHLSRLVEQAAAGEEIIIAKSGKPVARLCPLAEPKKPRVLGRLRGQIVVPDDFDTLCEDEIRELFEKGC